MYNFRKVSGGAAGTTELENYPESLTGGLPRRSERAVVDAAALANTYAACTRLLWGACQRVPVASRVHLHLNSVHLHRRQKLRVSHINAAKTERSAFFSARPRAIRGPVTLLSIFTLKEPYNMYCYHVDMYCCHDNSQVHGVSAETGSSRVRNAVGCFGCIFLRMAAVKVDGDGGDVCR